MGHGLRCSGSCQHPLVSDSLALRVNGFYGMTQASSRISSRGERRSIAHKTEGGRASLLWQIQGRMSLIPSVHLPASAVQAVLLPRSRILMGRRFMDDT